MNRQQIAVARIRLWLLKTYLADLEAFVQGDVNRFGRMVDGKGGSLGSAEKWTAFVVTLLQNDGIREYCTDDWRRCHERAAVLKIQGVTR